MITFTAKAFANFATVATLAVSCGSISAQVAYEAIEVGTTLNQSGIALGIFVKPIPLPQGTWQVKAKRVDQLSLRGGRSDSPSSTPRVALWLKNTESSTAPIAGIIMTFTPDSVPISWGNNKCASPDTKPIVDDFGFDANAMLYACAYGDNWSKFRNVLATAPDSKNDWIKSNMSAFTPDANDFPDDTVQFAISSNKFRGKNMAFRFILRREGDFVNDSAYRDYLKAWAHSAGLTLTNVLNNDAAAFETPAGYAKK